MLTVGRPGTQCPREFGEEMGAGWGLLAWIGRFVCQGCSSASCQAARLVQDDTVLLLCCVPRCAWSDKRWASVFSSLTGTECAGWLLGENLVWVGVGDEGPSSRSVCLRKINVGSSGVYVTPRPGGVVRVERRSSGSSRRRAEDRVHGGPWIRKTEDPTRHVTRFVGRVWRGQSRDYA